MKIIAQHRALVAFAVAGIAVTAAQAQSAVNETPWQWHPSGAVVESVPPLPPPTTYPVQLVLDDDTSDGAFGVGAQTARQFLWFNRFSAAAGFHLDEVWVLFPSGANMAVGAAVQISIYEDPDNDPTNGANWIGSFAATIQAADDNTFSIYPVPGSPVIPAGSDLLVGVVPRFIVSGVTSPTLPAALDTTATQSRSWVAAWTADPPDPPVLVPLPDQTLSLVDSFVPGGGNFMIRAFGTEQAVTEIPTLGGAGFAALALSLLAAGAFVLRRRRAAGALALFLLALAAPAGAVTIDSFTTNQAAVSDPPGTGSSVTGGADIIGTRRGLVPNLLLGAGPATASVAAGNLTLLVTDTTPNSRGEVLVSWDGDTNQAVLSPTGLGNANLTSGNASGFRLDFASTTVVTEVEITVYDDAANFSRAVRRVPVSASAQSVSIPFAEFRVAGGSGAVFSSVGAIEMKVRSGEGAVNLSEVSTTAPTVAATKIDTQIVDNDGDTRVDPGDRVRYTVTVTNTGNEALAVDLSDTVDANTTLVAGSVSSTPVAHNDQYGWFGNVTFATDGSAAKPNLLANDQDADGDTLTVQSGTFPATTAAGGTLTLVSAATGEFSYSPPAGFSGVDSFNYTVLDDNGNTSTATANIALQGVVWFVDDSNTTAPFLGTFADPFQALASVNGAGDPDLPGDVIFVYDDNGTPYAGGLVLEADQTLLGEAAGLVLDGTTIVPVGNRPQITNAAGIGLSLATNNTLGGFDIQNTSGTGIFGSAFGTLAATNVNVLTTGGTTLDLTTGALSSVVFGTLSSTGAGGQRGLVLSAVTGSLTATTTTLTNPTLDGIRVVNSPGVAVNFGATTVTDNAIGSAPQANGINLVTPNTGATFTFSSLAITADGGSGISALNGGTIQIAGTGNSIASTSGPAVSITSTSFGSGATFATVSSTNSSTFGLLLDTVSGSFVANGGSLSGAASNCLDINGGSGTITYSGTISCTASRVAEITGRTGGAVTLSGNLTANGSAAGINVASNSAGAVTFSGGSKSLSTTTGTAVTLATNSGATINFTNGGLAISTTSGTGFNATGGAAITVQGSGNTLTTTAGTGLNVANTTIGANGLNFQSISVGTGVGSAGVGISLDTTGGSGGLTVAGTGSAGSGGTIQHKTGADGSTTSGIGIYLNNTTNPSFSWMQLNDFDNTAIIGRSVQGFALQNSVISGTNGTTNVGVDGAIAFGTSNPGGTNGLQGTGLIHNTKISGGVEHNVEFYNQSGSMNLTIDGSTAVSEGANPNSGADDVADCIIEENSVALGGDGIQVEMQGSATATIVVDRCLFRDNKSQAVQVAANDSSALTVTIDESVTRRFDQGNEGFLSSNGSNGDLTLMYSNNRCSNTNGTCFFVGQTPGNATSSSFLNATIANNIVNMPTTATNHGILAFLTSTIGQISTARLRIDGNVVTNNSTSGTTRGILVDTPDSNTSPKFDATVTNNSVSVGDNVAGVAGLVVQGRQTSDACASIGGNTVTFPNGTPGGVFGLRARQANTATFDLEQSGPCSGAAAAVLACRNPAATTEVLGTLVVSAVGSCLTPSVP